MKKLLLLPLLLLASCGIPKIISVDQGPFDIGEVVDVTVFGGTEGEVCTLTYTDLAGKSQEQNGTYDVTGACAFMVEIPAWECIVFSVNPDSETEDQYRDIRPPDPDK